MSGPRAVSRFAPAPQTTRTGVRAVVKSQTRRAFARLSRMQPCDWPGSCRAAVGVHLGAGGAVVGMRWKPMPQGANRTKSSSQACPLVVVLRRIAGLHRSTSRAQ